MHLNQGLNDPNVIGMQNVQEIRSGCKFVWANLTRRDGFLDGIQSLVFLAYETRD